MANSNISSIGRFSSQMLTYLGTQRTVKNVGGSPANTYKYATGPVVFPDPSSANQAMMGEGVVGSFSPNTYNTTKCYFLSRGASQVYADAMTSLTVDMARTLNTTPLAFLEKMNPAGKLELTAEAYRSFNVLRDPGNQVGAVKTVSNKNSLQSREIRS